MVKKQKVPTEWDKECIRTKANQAAKLGRFLQKMATDLRSAVKNDKKALVVDVTEINLSMIDTEFNVLKLNRIMRKYGAEWTKN
jgi:hypothetical protein